MAVDHEKLPMFLSLDEDANDGNITLTRIKDEICRGNSRHGAPCTTLVVLCKCLVALLIIALLMVIQRMLEPNKNYFAGAQETSTQADVVQESARS